jgi:hypothetical protein
MPRGRWQLAGLVLDDVLWAIRDIRRQFKLPKPHFGLKQIEREAGARKALCEIIEATKERHGREICSKGQALLEELGPEIYAEEIKDSAFSGYWRLSPSHVGRALRRVFEIALQTLVQSPARDPKVPIAKDRLASLAFERSGANLRCWRNRYRGSNDRSFLASAALDSRANR